MTFLRFAGRGVVVVVVIAAALALGNSLRAIRSQQPVTPEPESGAGAGSPTAAASANCVVLGRVTPKIAPPLTIQGLGNGSDQVTSAEGGYSLLLPAKWFKSATSIGITAGFGQLQATSYDPKTAPTPDPERWMLPPEVGISLVVQVWANPDHETVDRYADHILIGPDQTVREPGRVTSIDGRSAYRFTIRDEHRFQRADGTLVMTKQTRVVWIAQSGHPDRVIVAYATPAENTLFSVAEDAVMNMTITAPFLSERPVVLQRDDVLSRWLYDKAGALIPGRRAEAKLLTFLEATTALNVGGGPPPPPGGPRPIQLLRLDHDPDDLFWVIAVSGPDLPQFRGGPPGLASNTPSTPPPTTWILSDQSATGTNTGTTGTQSSSQGNWPQNFDALPDRCR